MVIGVHGWLQVVTGGCKSLRMVTGCYGGLGGLRMVMGGEGGYVWLRVDMGVTGITGVMGG